MANHTPLPWGVWEDRVFGGTAIVGSDGARAVGFTKGVGDRDMIVACVNACGAVNPANPAAAAEALAGLIAACAGLLESFEHGDAWESYKAMKRARAAVALATGEGTP